MLASLRIFLFPPLTSHLNPFLVDLSPAGTKPRFFLRFLNTQETQMNDMHPLIIQCKYQHFTYPIRRLQLPSGSVWTVGCESTLPNAPAAVDNQIMYYFPDHAFYALSDAELLDEIGDCT